MKYWPSGDVHVQSRLLCCWMQAFAMTSVFTMTSVFSWQNTVSLCPASFPTPWPKIPVTPGNSWLPTFAFQYRMMKRTSFLLVLESVVGLHETSPLQLLWHQWLWLDVDHHDAECFALETNRDHAAVLEIAPKYCILDSSVDYEGYSISSEGFLPT